MPTQQQILYIIVAANESYSAAAALIADECRSLSLEARIRNIEVFDFHTVERRDVVYFLTTAQRVGGLAGELRSRGVAVINGRYLVGSRLKSHMQLQIGAAGVQVPKLVRIPSGAPSSEESLLVVLSGLCFPLFIKSELHAHGVFLVDSAPAFSANLNRLDSKLGWYAEEAVGDPGADTLKLYWVNGATWTRDGSTPVNLELSKVAAKVAECLKLDALSLDLVSSGTQYWCIDVNPAPALYGSARARAEFAHAIRQHFSNHD